MRKQLAPAAARLRVGSRPRLPSEWRATLGFVDDSPLEGNGFELLVPRGDRLRSPVEDHTADQLPIRVGRFGACAAGSRGC
jgi:hypothetical protein